MWLHLESILLHFFVSSSQILTGPLMLCIHQGLRVKEDTKRILLLEVQEEYSLSFLFFNFIILDFWERGRQEGEGEKHWCERETSIGCLSYVPWLGTEPATLACVLTWNQTDDLLVCRRTPIQLSHKGWGWKSRFLKHQYFPNPDSVAILRVNYKV